MEIKDKTPQEIQTQFTYREVAYSISSPMMKMGYDSKNPVENLSEMDKILYKIFGSMIDKPFMAVIAPDGSVKSVTGMDAIAESMSAAISADGPMAAQIGEQMKQLFGGDAIKSSFEQSFKMYPANAVNVGDSWNMENTMMISNMNASFKTKYTLKAVNRNMATIAVESTIEIETGAGMEGKLAGTQTGTIVVDTETGLHVTGDMLQNIVGIVKAQGMEVQMEMTTNAKTSTKEVK
jgi:hypothetical protein